MGRDNKGGSPLDDAVRQGHVTVQVKDNNPNRYNFKHKHKHLTAWQCLKALDRKKKDVRDQLLVF